MNARLRKTLLFAILAGTLGIVILDRPEEGAPARAVSRSRTAAPGPNVQAADASRPQGGSQVPALALPERAPLGEEHTGLFSSYSWQPPPSKAAEVARPAPPVAPPLPYRFAGQLIQGGRPEVFLAKGDTVVPVGKGDVLDGTYRVESIEETRITLLYLPLKQKQSIPVFGVLPVTEAAGQARAAPAQALPQGAPPVAQASVSMPPPAGTVSADSGSSGPARLLWDGPQHVRLGSQFSVALKVTSEQPLSVSPMQIRFDPSLLQNIAVKPGRFLGADERNFSYRVRQDDGLIYVGATKQGSQPAADAEFLVFVFKPLKTASAAELSIASLNLQGPAGRTIAYNPLAAFRTAITP